MKKNKILLDELKLVEVLIKKVYISIVNILISSYTLTIQKHKTNPFKIPSQDKP